MFFATRAAAKIPDVPSSTPLRPIKSVAVIGAGTMGGGIAMNFANAGVPVTVLETSQAALDKGLGIVRKNYESTLKKGRLTQDEFDKRLSLIRGTLSYDDIAQRRSRDRGGVRGHAGEEAGVRDARRQGEARRDSRLQHLDAWI